MNPAATNYSASPAGAGAAFVPALLDDYWMQLVRGAVKNLLLQDAMLYAGGALPIRALDYTHARTLEELDDEIMASRDAQVREGWKELVRSVPRHLRVHLLVVVKSILTMLPDEFITRENIPRVVDSLEFV